MNPHIVQMLGLNHRLQASGGRNGIVSTLKLMQKETLRMYMDSGAGKLASAGSGRGNATEARASSTDPSAGGTTEQRSMKASIEKKLREALAPTVLVVDDVSHRHAGHAGVEKGATETHFNVTVVSDKFKDTSLIKRHRLVYSLLDDELKNGVHALSLVTKTNSEPVSKNTAEV